MPSFASITHTFAAALAAAAVLTACSSSTDNATPSPTEPASSTTTSTAPTTTAESTDLGPLLTVTIDSDEVLPNAEEIDLSTGQKLLIEIESDRAGELHVHSSPEQFIEFNAGTTQTELVIETPGTVEIEDDDTGDVVALIEVR